MASLGVWEWLFTIAVFSAIIAWRLYPKLFFKSDPLRIWKKYALTFCAALAITLFFWGGAVYLDTYHNPGRALTEGENLVFQGIFLLILSVPVVIGWLVRRLIRRSRKPVNS
jgi:hypothetical protein